jgi:uncharacterized protein (DUF305 family)
MRPSRMLVLGLAGLVGLHVFMLAGHGRSHDVPMLSQVAESPMSVHAGPSVSRSLLPVPPLPAGHHGAGMAMTVACLAKLVDSHTKRPQLRTLADSIVVSQGQEVTLMQGWLKRWGKPATPAGTDHGAMHMPGMMSEAQMRQLTVIKNQDFDLAFLNVMTTHHQGAIEMANTELRDGSLPEVKQLAQQIVDVQQGEIDQFNAWQQEWEALPIR